MPTVGIACPFCCKSIDSCGLAAGARVRCPRCRAAFTLRPEDLRAAALAAPPAVPVSRPAPSLAAPAARSIPPLSRAWLLALAGGGAAVLLLIAATAGVALLLAARRTPQVAVTPAPTPSSAANPDPVEPPRLPDAHSKPPKEKPPPLRPPPVHDAPPELTPDPPAPKPTELPPDLRDKVHKAIERGVAFLKGTQKDDGSWQDDPISTLGGYRVGLSALVAWTLLECGVPADAPEVRKAATLVRTGAPALNSSTDTYQLALAILFLDRLRDPADEPLIQSAALRLIAGQGNAGGWSYRCPTLKRQEEVDLTAALRVTRPTSSLELFEGRTGAGPPEGPAVNQGAPDAAKALAALPQALRDVPALQPPRKEAAFPVREDVGDPSRADPRFADNSNTQFAILGLWTARRHDVPADRALALVSQRFRISQREKGGWGYLFGKEKEGGAGGDVGWRWDPSQSMTAAGLLGLAVGRGLLVDLKGNAAAPPAENDPAVEKGMRALSEFIVWPPGPNPWRLYFLWSVERVGVLYGRKTIGDKEWYPWGANILVGAQAGDGSWMDIAGPPQVGSCFALLFLARANPVRDLSTKLEFLSEVKPKSPKP